MLEITEILGNRQDLDDIGSGNVTLFAIAKKP